MFGIRSRSSGEPLPRVFLEEPHGRVERRPAPHLEREQAGVLRGVDGRDAEHVVGAHPRRQQRLVGVAERRVGEQQRLLLADPLRRTSRRPVRLNLSRVPCGRARRRGRRSAAAAPARGRPSRSAGVACRCTSGLPLTITSAMYVSSLRRPVLRGREAGTARASRR